MPDKIRSSFSLLAASALSRLLLALVFIGFIWLAIQWAVAVQ
ncbi:hypothetical protein [Allorhizobium sonneratiae]|nr:hypothetical protein [Allorhizobium sonneratiae]